jgi:peptide-methionine (R)-S-oxide reductase
MLAGMTDRRSFLTIAGLGAITTAVFWPRGESVAAKGSFPYTRTDAEWRKTLSPAAYEVLRHEDTERPFTSPLNKEKRAGIFACAGCALPLFSSKTKFESGTGWPSFYAPLRNAVATRKDNRLFFTRTEVHCRRCGGHLGHVFDDGPKPTGLRYCMNGLAMNFRPA